MTQFSSREPFNDDPEPWSNEAWKNTPHHRYSERTQSDDKFDPRPEYERPQTNSTNLILTDFRALHESTGNTLWPDAYLYSSDLIEDWEKYDSDHWEHAMDVLMRIVRVFR